MIKLVAVDIDGTFIHDDYTFDVERFEKIFKHMKAINCNFVVASGNQFYQLEKIFKKYGNEISFVSDNGAYVKAHGELIFAADVPKETVAFVTDICRNFSEVTTFLCGVKSAYAERGKVTQECFERMKAHYMPRMIWVDDFKAVEDQFLKFALLVPENENSHYYKIFKEKLGDKLKPITSGFGAMDLIVSKYHKASGIKRLAEHFNISADECVSFGDSYNDIEMLKYCGQSYAMANATDDVKAAAKNICPSNNDDGVLVTLEKILYQ